MSSQLDPNENWWRSAVIYQIYPRSFQDTNGDGIGDIPGIIQRLPYISRLGVDAIWISPFFRSPMRDFGYDVSDYCDIDPMFGSLSDYDELVKQAHAHGLRIMIDLVLSHTSDQHAWFKESCSSKSNPRADWYVWADPKPDGTPPNNWQWNTRRQQYFLHNFLSSQPDLNYHCPAVREAVLDVAKFWLDRGTDGFRLDVVNLYYHDSQLRDNPAQPADSFAGAVMPTNPYARQVHVYDKSRPENLEFLSRLRALTDQYPSRVTLGEISDDRQYFRLGEYTAGTDRLHLGYVFRLLEKDCSPRFIHGVLEEYIRDAGQSVVCWSLGNHDSVRVVSRWAGMGGTPEARARILIAFLLCLPGAKCIYQGEELAFEEADIPYELLQDPYGKSMWPEYKGRDGCRTPIAWSQSKEGGFTSGEHPWLPVSADHVARSALSQAERKDSIYAHYHQLLLWHKKHGAFREISTSLLPAHDQIVAFKRGSGKDALIAMFNLSSSDASYPLPAGVKAKKIEVPNFSSEITAGVAFIPGMSACVCQIE